MSPSRDVSVPTSFSELGLIDDLAAVVSALGYEEPTPIQRAAIPIILSGVDLLAQAATGTGKTAAFALPMLHLLLDPSAVPPAGTPPGGTASTDRTLRAAGIHTDKPRLIKPASHARTPAKPERPGPPPAGTSSIVLVPTRELAMQVSEAIHKYAGGTGIHVVPLYGGASMEQQIRALQRGAQVVVATPGRALDHLRRKTLVLDAVRMLVLDEADEMLDMGFADDIEAILAATPAGRQTALFSATLPARILKIAERHLRTPRRITIADAAPKAGSVPRVRQVAYIVRRDQKPAALDRILDMEHPGSAIVFCRTRVEVDTLVQMLNAHAYKAEALHGGMLQRQRDAVMNRVRSGKTDLLVATCAPTVSNRPRPRCASGSRPVTSTTSAPW
jgi:ATP-dependent RNA helicase DeaD